LDEYPCESATTTRQYASRAGETNGMSFQLPLRGPIENASDVLAHSLDRATDRLYKDAARQYLRVRPPKTFAWKAKTNPRLRAPSTRDITPCMQPHRPRSELPSTRTWKSGSEPARVVRTIRLQRHIQNSHISLVVRAATRYTVSSDGLCNMERRSLPYRPVARQGCRRL